MIERGKPLESGSQRVEKWDPDRNTLIVEIIEPLKPGLHDVTIQMSQGRMVVEGSDDPAPRLVTRLYVFASSQDEARNFLQAKNCGFKIRKGPGSISVDAGSQEGVIIQGGNIVIGRGGISVMISGDLSGGIVVSEGEVWINGQRVDSSRGAQVFPSTQREVVLSVPRADRPRYSLHTQAGSVEIKKTGGECTILTNAANVQIEKYTGNVSLENQSGNVQIESLKGDLFIHATSGNIGVNDFDGLLNLTAISGDVQLMRAIFKGTSNNINVTSGNIRVSVANDSLLVSAQTSSGTITTPHGNEFVIVQEECPNTEGRASRHGIIVIASANSIVSIGGSSRSRCVEGRFGQLEIPENKLFSHSTSVDITLVKS